MFTVDCKSNNLKNIYKKFNRNFFYRNSTIGTTTVAIEANNDTYCLHNRIEKFQLFGML